MITGNERDVIDTLNTVAAIHRKTPDDNTTATTASGGKDFDDAGIHTYPIPLRNGGSIPIPYKDENFKTIYKDESTGEVRPLHLARAAMEDNLGISTTTYGMPLRRTLLSRLTIYNRCG